MKCGQAPKEIPVNYFITLIRTRRQLQINFIALKGCQPFVYWLLPPNRIINFILLKKKQDISTTII